MSCLCLPGGHHVIVVNELHEDLDARLLGGLLLVHGTCDLLRSLPDSNNQGVSVGALWCSLIKVLHNDSLLAGILSTDDNNDLSLL